MPSLPRERYGSQRRFHVRSSMPFWSSRRGGARMLSQVPLAYFLSENTCFLLITTRP